jgi:hypothetical protein
MLISSIQDFGLADTMPAVGIALNFSYNRLPPSPPYAIPLSQGNRTVRYFEHTGFQLKPSLKPSSSACSPKYGFEGSVGADALRTFLSSFLDGKLSPSYKVLLAWRFYAVISHKYCWE